MKVVFDASGIVIVASHAVGNDTEVEIARFPNTEEVFSVVGQRSRLLQLFEAAVRLLKDSHDDYCLYLIRDKTVASNEFQTLVQMADGVVEIVGAAKAN